MRRWLPMLPVACLALSMTAAGPAPAGEPPLVTPSPGAIDAVQYFYGDFPRQLAALDSELALAERAAAILQARVSSYRPFRSFHQYGATYFADQWSQLELLSAQQRVECLKRDREDLWRRRQLMGAWLMTAPSATAVGR
jgi:hypothetical protein